MIFLLWTFAVIAFASRPDILLLPILATIIRGVYLGRSAVVAINASAIAAAAVYMLLLQRLTGLSASVAFLMAAKIVAGSIVLTHVIAGLGEVPTRYLGPLGRYFIAYARANQLIRERLHELGYAFRIRWYARRRFKQRVILVGYAAAAAATELWQISDELVRLLLIRSGAGAAVHWANPPAHRYPLLVGDLALAVVAAALLAAGIPHELSLRW